MIELSECWEGILYMSILSVVLAFVYIGLLKWITKPILYVSLLVILGCFVLLGLWSFNKSKDFKLGDEQLWDKKYSNTNPKPEMKPEDYSDNYYYAMYGSYVAWGIAAIYFICVCCCWKNIALGASIMEAASEFVTETIRILVLPPLAYIVSMVWVTFWLISAIYLYSIGEPEFRPNTFIANIKWTDQ